MTQGEPRLNLPSGTLPREVLIVLWEIGSGSVWDVKERVEQRLKLNLNYTTVASAVTKLQSLGAIDRSKPLGSTTWNYSPIVSREKIDSATFKEAVRLLLENYESESQALAQLVNVIAEIDGQFLFEFDRAIKQKREGSRTRKPPK